MLNNNWTFEQAAQTFALPFNDLIYAAHTTLRQHFNANTLQISTLVNIKTMNCSENCTYCSQSAHYKNHHKSEPLMSLETVIAAAKKLKATGSNRLCMGAAWRGPKTLN